MAGISAGSICWFEEGVTDSFGDGLAPLKAIGFLKGSNCPHYDGEAERRPTYRKLIDEGTLQLGIAADDGAAIHYVDGKIKKIISSPRAAKGYFVSRDKEEEIVTEYLGD